MDLLNSVGKGYCSIYFALFMYKSIFIMITFRSATKTHSGTYSCHIESSEGEFSTECIVKVTAFVKPLKPFYKKRLQATKAVSGEEVQFCCTVDGSPTPR